MTGKCPVCAATVPAVPSARYEGLADLAGHDNRLVTGCLIPPQCIGSGCAVAPVVAAGKAAALNRWLVVDLFSGEGGASRGYADAGCEVLGVDVRPQARYPFAMVQADALAFLAAADLSGVALIGASPPCPRYARPTLASARSRHPDLIAPTRAALMATGRPWVMENVPGAPMAAADTLDGVHAITLCGCMFGLAAGWPKGRQHVALYRERLFESSHALPQPPHKPHVLPSVSVNRRGGRFNGPGEHHNRSVSLEVCQELMRAPWTSQSGLGNAIPPAYTAYIGLHLLTAVAAMKAEAA